MHVQINDGDGSMLNFFPAFNLGVEVSGYRFAVRLDDGRLKEIIPSDLYLGISMKDLYN